MELATAERARKGWLDDWDPENEEFWESTGQQVARRNLAWSVFGDHLGSAVWVLWTIVVLNLAEAGIDLSVPELFWLTAVPNLVGSFLRIPYTFAVPRFGGRAWTATSTALLLIPTLLLGIVVPSGWLAGQGHGTQFWVLLLCAASAGLGGGKFSSSMFNISFFFPERKKGFALGLNAAGGNLGVAVAQLVVPLVVIAWGLAYAGFIWVPLILLAVFGARRHMNSLTQARADRSAYRDALGNGQTWVMSLIYIGTFGSFIGFSFSLPLVIRTTFPDFLAAHPFIATYLAGLGFLGALIGSLSRPLGGWLADRHGGARVTLGCFAGAALFTGTAIMGVNNRSFFTFFASYMVIFLMVGMANGSAYKMIPAIFATLGREAAGEPGADGKAVLIHYKQQAAAVIGIAGAIGAFGGFLVQVVLRQANLPVAALVKAAETPAAKLVVAADHADWSVPALTTFLAGYLVLGFLTWFVYLRRSFATQTIPSLAHATI